MTPVPRRVNEEKEMDRFGRVAMVVAVAATAAASCAPPAGLNVPVEEARAGGRAYPVYQAAAPLTEPGRTLVADGRQWLAFDAPSPTYGAGYGVEIPQPMMQPVGTVDGVQLYALATDRSPYARLYSPIAPGRWREYRPASF
jgi:hypothetical protein